MADKAPETLGYDADLFDFETVHEEAGDQIVFEKIGDTYIGEFLGIRTITFTDMDGEEKSFKQLQFRDPSGPKVINAGYELSQIYETIPAHTITRTMLANQVDVGKGKNAMNSFRVDEAKARNAGSQKK
jgi:hypothetical protein